RLPELKSNDFFVLFILADTCRVDCRIASISMSELERLTDLGRTTVWRSLTKLTHLGYLKKLGGGNQHQANRYEVLPANTLQADVRSDCSTGETITPTTTSTAPTSDCSAGETITEEVIVSNGKVIVSNGKVIVSNEASDCFTGETHPEIPVT